MDEIIQKDEKIDEIRPLRLGIVGTGRATLLNHLPALRTIPNLFQITAVCDMLKDRRDQIVQYYPKVHTYRQIEDMLDDPSLDVVLCALPTLFQTECALASLQRGRSTVIETPFATSYEEALHLKAASVKTRDRLFAYTPGIFSSEFYLAKSVLSDSRLGNIFDIHIRRHDYLRRDDWQTIKRRRGGCLWYEGQDALLQVIKLLPEAPSQLWSDLKRVITLGDAEDYAHIVLKSRGETVSADLEICNGILPPYESVITIRGNRGCFTVNRNATEGNLHIIDPKYKFPRRRSSVRTPDLDDLHEDFPIIDVPVTLNKPAESAAASFWRAVYNTIRKANIFPVQLDEIIEIIKYLQLIKGASQFAK